LVFLILAATATLVGLEAFRISFQQQEEKFEQEASCVELCGVRTSYLCETILTKFLCTLCLVSFCHSTKS
jgi:hypothetical protein